MPNYGIKTQYVSIKSTSQKFKQIREKSNNGTALFISKPVKCQQQRKNKEETIKDKGREEKREQKSREEKRREEKR